MTDKSSDAHVNNLDLIGEELRHWPYTIHQIDDTLDSRLIEGRAKQLLFQALNSRSVTAFVGSGISAAYGRMSWHEWKDKQLVHVSILSEKFLEVAERSIAYMDELCTHTDDLDPKEVEVLEPGGETIDKKTILTAIRLSRKWLRYRQKIIQRAAWDVRNLRSTFVASASKNGSFPGGEDLPVLFEIAKKLHDLLVRNRYLFILEEGECAWGGAYPNGVSVDNPNIVFGTVARKAEGASVDQLEVFFKFLKIRGKYFIKDPAEDTRLATYIESLKEYYDKAGRAEASLEFDELAKNLLVDECAHAEELLKHAFEFEKGSGRKESEADEKILTLLREDISFTKNSNLKRNIDGIRQSPDRYKVLTPFKIARLQTLIKEVKDKDKIPKNWHGLLEIIDNFYENYLDDNRSALLDSNRIYLTPTSRFLLPVVYRLLESPGAFFHAGEDRDRQKPDDLGLPTSEDFQSRRSIMARRFDPLEKISEGLRIRRYLTTNYDFEIERLYQDKGYRHFDPHKALLDPKDVPSDDPKRFRTNGLGGLMRDQTFAGKTATDLLAFSAGGTGADVSIFHLHGRATRNDSIVATERDYMDLYLRNDPDRSVVDESILMAFAATPILFLGLGMEEADVLRPLRQFMSDQDRSVGYRSIVLLPADKDFDSRTKMAAGLYLRYGAHTMFFGGGEVPVREVDGGEVRIVRHQSIDWLHEIMKLIGILEEAAEGRLKKLKEIANEGAEDESREHQKATPEAKDKKSNKEIEQKYKALGYEPLLELKTLRDKMGKLGKELVVPKSSEGKSKDVFVLKFLLARIVNCDPDTPKYKKNFDFSDEAFQGVADGETLVTHDELVDQFEIQNCHFTNRRHQSLMKGSSHRHQKIDGTEFTKFYCQILSALMRQAVKKQEYSDYCEALRSLNAYKEALNGLKGAFLTSSLNASLEGLEKEWHAWWKDWQTIPPVRESQFEEITDEKIPLTEAFKEVVCNNGIARETLVSEGERRQEIRLPQRVIRHRVESIITDMRRCNFLTAPDYNVDHQDETAYPPEFQTGVRVFDKFIYDVAQSDHAPRTENGRVIYAVAADRGQGKGVFFSTLATRLGLSSYIRAAHGTDQQEIPPENGEPGKSKPSQNLPAFTSSIFINLSFATEVASVFDMLNEHLTRAVAQLKVAANPHNKKFARVTFEEFLTRQRHEKSEVWFAFQTFLSQQPNEEQSWTGFEEFAGGAGNGGGPDRPLDKKYELLESFGSELKKHKHLRNRFGKDLLGILKRRTLWPGKGPNDAERFQRLRDLLREDTAALEVLWQGKEEDPNVTGVAQETERLRNKISGLPRTEKFKQLMRAFKEAAEEAQGRNIFLVSGNPRLLICINAVELLFDDRKQPKNCEIADYLRFLGAEEQEDLPFDLIAIGDLGKMGGFLKGGDTYPRGTSASPELAEDIRYAIRKRAEVGKVDWIEKPDEKTGKTPTTGDEASNGETRPKKYLTYVHFARDIDPPRFLVDNFSTLAIALLLARKLRQRETAADSQDDPFTNEKSKELDKTIKGLADKLREDRQGLWDRDFPPEVNTEYLRTRRDFHIGVAEAAREAFEDFAAKTGTKSDFDFDQPVTQHTFQQFKNWLFGEFVPDDGSEDSRDWQDLTSLLSGNRFCLTILLAAAEHLVFSNRSFVRGGEIVNEMLEKIVSDLRNTSANAKEDVVLDTVMAICRRTSIIGDPDNDWELHTLLLRNIAVLGCPVSPNVLVRLPDIRDYFNKVQFVPNLSRRRMVAMALAAMSERGLVFRLKPHPKLVRLNKLARLHEVSENAGDRMPVEVYEPLRQAFDGWAAEREFRYALHRQIQGYCFHGLGHLTAPPVSANSFSPTLYASMPSRVVRLSSEGYLFLRRLLLGLSQYPDIRHKDAARNAPIFNTDDVITRVQALRAGLSLARTCFSIAAVSRFDEDMTGRDFIRKRGHFETYRVRLRWILRKAWAVHDQPRSDAMDLKTEQERKLEQGKKGEQEKNAGKEALRKYDADPDKYRVNALYIDEIVWLYNEVAVTCLVQGALIEAIGHARQAIFINREIEGQLDGGRMHNMLSLNLAIIQYERGRLASAEARLKAILSTEDNGTRRVAHLAKGYLGLIALLQGRRREAKFELLKVARALSNDQEDRALAIFLRHLALLVAPDDADEAWSYLARARDYSEKGGHEDVRHLILVSEVWVSQRHLEQPWERVLSDRVKLREAQRYAEVMGLDSLLVDTLHAQGMMLYNAGDHSSSGRLMTKAMAIARRNDMTLRLNRIMTDYSRVLLARRRVASAKRLLMSSLTMAKRSGHSSEVVRIREVWDEAERQDVEDA
ncbi:SIR2 family protein [Labrenzia sp. OB1]|uniref:SIR2 family protein n=1 Tax=Labrenzia sp. OB1 TaxID=1561204 RepID=UPI0007B20EC6|nr:SIR2 family protein [Labrenzia sp. OB1]KZM49786.1 hypothetical protein OA90_12845 [Labrenzia sp. OB1]